MVEDLATFCKESGFDQKAIRLQGLVALLA
jgi:hypothetical protein